METFFLLGVMSIGQENSPVGILSLDPGFCLSKEVFLFPPLLLPDLFQNISIRLAHKTRIDSF